MARKRKQMSLVKQVQQAKRAEDAMWKRLKNKEAEARRANAISDGAMIWVTILASLIGDAVHITKDQIDMGKQLEYVVRMNTDGSMDVVRKGLEDTV